MLGIFVLAFLGSPQAPEAENIVRRNLQAAVGFEFKGSSHEDNGPSFTASGWSRRESDLATLSLSAQRISTRHTPEEYWTGISPALLSNEPPLGYSGFPVAENARRGGSQASSFLQAYDGRIFVKCSLSYRPYIDQGGIPRWRAADPEGDKDVCEGIARFTLAEVRGFDGQQSSPVNIGGFPIAALTGPRGERLVDLAGYCQVLELNLRTNGVLGTASFTVGGEQVIIPLAAKGIKDGPRWIETNDISLIKDGKWYVSYAALQEARGQ